MVVVVVAVMGEVLGGGAGGSAASRLSDYSRSEGCHVLFLTREIIMTFALFM